MGGDDSQKLLSWRGSTPLQGANLRLYYEINNVTDTALGNLARGTPSFCRSGRGLSSDHGSLLESRGGSLLARAEAATQRSHGDLYLPRSLISVTVV